MSCQFVIKLNSCIFRKIRQIILKLRAKIIDIFVTLKIFMNVTSRNVVDRNPCYVF